MEASDGLATRFSFVMSIPSRIIAPLWDKRVCGVMYSPLCKAFLIGETNKELQSEPELFGFLKRSLNETFPRNAINSDQPRAEQSEAAGLGDCGR